MARHGFGKGEYRYFNDLLPALLQTLRTALYSSLAPIAKDWNERMGLVRSYPDEHDDFLKLCHDGGQTRTTPLVQRFGTGDFNSRQDTRRVGKECVSKGRYRREQ